MGKIHKNKNSNLSFFRFCYLFKNSKPKIDVYSKRFNSELIFKPKKSFSRLMLLSLLFLTSFSLLAQNNKVAFKYDGAGNRIKRFQPLNFDIKVYLEGALVDDFSLPFMRNSLYAKEILPGMQITNNPLQLEETPAGHPYAVEPWNYDGTEGDNFDNSSYSSEVVDWVLVSLRTGEDHTTEVMRFATLLKANGSFLLVNSIDIPSSASSFYIVIQHRNHLPVMSASLVDVVDGTLSYDFTAEDSWRTSTSIGQIQHPDFGVWMMYAANGEQNSSSSSFSQKDITGEDKIIWSDENGNFQQYLISDFNLDSDVNGSDKSFWESNNGNSSGISVEN